MSETILRSEVFKQLHARESFDMVWITCDRRRGAGGDIISAEGWMFVSDEIQEGRKAKNTSDKQAATTSLDRRDPNHPQNGTVNVFNPANSQVHIHKVHLDLIQFFNGKRVIN